jgi:predicted alpha/beta-fold hydrolase
VPLLAVNAVDDPIVRALPDDVGGNGWVALIVTSGGGHLGWFGGGNGVFGIQRWITQPVLVSEKNRGRLVKMNIDGRSGLKQQRRTT